VCDAVYDCADHSDEVSCSTITTPHLPTEPSKISSTVGAHSSSVAMIALVGAACVIVVGVGVAVWQWRASRRGHANWERVPATVTMNTAYERADPNFKDDVAWVGASF
jgi:hypothetical protein